MPKTADIFEIINDEVKKVVESQLFSSTVQGKGVTLAEILNAIKAAPPAPKKQANPGETLAAILDEINTMVTKHEAKKAKPTKIDNSEALKNSGAKVIHFPPVTDLPGISIAYRQKHKKDTTMEFSVAVCHSKDTFSKKMGTKLALERLAEGKSVVFPTMGVTPNQIFRHLFG